MISNHFAAHSHALAIEEVKEQHRANLKTYALNASEKVGNLSNELSRLSVFLEAELNYEEENPELDNLALTERLESAIHIINTLKSVNDTSLSDWRGVIGDELHEQMEEQRERETKFEELVDRVEEIVDAQTDSKPEFDVYSEIKSIKKELSLAITSLGGTIGGRRKSKRPPREDISKRCPICESYVAYRQRPSENASKQVTCTSCGTKMLSKWNETEGFYFELERFIDESIICPWCNEVSNISLSSLPTVNKTVECGHCHGSMIICRRNNSPHLTKVGKDPSRQAPLTDQILNLIENTMPKQPWIPGVHKEVASKLGLSSSLVYRGINTLIEQGKFFPQVNGVVYEKRVEN
jgi:hypothetical protein